MSANESDASSDLVRKRVGETDQQEKKQKQADDAHQEGKPSDVLRLNVGGTKVEVLRSTLTAVEGSLLASQFSGRWDEGLSKDAKGNFFIDQPPALFLPLIDFLRSYSLMPPQNAPNVPCPQFGQPHAWHIFCRMVEHYGLASAVFPCGIFDGGEPVVLGNELPGFRIETKVCQYFWVGMVIDAPVALQAFEVTLGKSTQAQIGWASVGIGNKQRLPVSLSESAEGVGYIDESIALDCVRGGVAICNTAIGGNMRNADTAQDKRFIPIDNFPSIGEGTVVRCEGYGRKFYVDGKLVASIEGDPDVALINNLALKYPAACLSVKGTIEVTSIERNYSVQLTRMM